MRSFLRGAVDDVIYERGIQDDKWGPQQDHPLELWPVILGEEFGEVCEAILDYRLISNEANKKALEKELIQTAAVAIHMIELLRAGVYNDTKGIR
jgi:NTP pyrophosphatase (non-canonical NTP hydrolase)